MGNIKNSLITICLFILLSACTKKEITMIETQKQYNEYLNYLQANSALMVEYEKENNEYYYFELVWPSIFRNEIVKISKNVIYMKKTIDLKQGDTVKRDMFILIK